MPVLQCAIDASKAKSGAQEFQQAANQVKNAANQAAGETGNLNKGLTGLGNTATSIKKAILEVGAAIGLTFTLKHVYDEVVGFDTALVSLGRSSGLQGKALDDLSDSILGLSRHIPVAATELAGIASVAAKLGAKGKDDILAFTEPIARLSVVTGEGANELAAGLAQLLTVSGGSTKEIGALAGELDELRLHTAESAGGILSAAGAVARATTGFHATAGEAMAIASVMSEIGGRAEFAGQAVAESMGKMSAAIGQGGLYLKDFSVFTGKSADELTRMFKDSPVDAFVLFLDSLHRASDEGKDLNRTLDLLGIGSGKASESLITMSKHVDKVEESLRLVREGGVKGIEIPDTLTNQLKILGNNLDAIALKMVSSDGLLADFKGMLKGMTDALASDQIGLAAEIFWATIKLEWTKGFAWISKMWDQFEPVFDEFGKRLVQTMGIAGANAGAALWAGMKNSAASYWEGMKHDQTIKDLTTDYMGQLDKMDPQWKQHQTAPAVQERFQSYNSVVAIENQRHQDEQSRLAGTGAVTDDMLKQMSGVWGKPWPSTLPSANAADVQQLDAGIQAAQAEVDRLRAQAKATSQPATMPASAPAGGGYSWIGDTTDLGMWGSASSGGGASGGSSDNAHSQAIRDRLTGYTNEQRALAQLLPQRQREAELLKIEADANLAFGKDSDAATASIREQIQGYDDLQKAQGDAEFDKVLQDLQDETRFTYLGNEQRAIEVELLKERNMLASHGITGADQDAQLRKLKDGLDQLQRAKDLQNLAHDMSNAFGDAFESVILGTKNLKQAFQSLMLDIEKIIIHDMVTVPLARGIEGLLGGAFGSLFGGGAPDMSGVPSGGHAMARGGAFDQTRLLPFAGGGIFDGPTFFRFAAGAGVMGEAGPEAIMPLDRGSDGKLGVRARAGGQSAIPVVIQIVNQSSQKVQAIPGRQTFDGEKYIQQVVLKDLDQFGPISQKLRTKGLQ